MDRSDPDAVRFAQFVAARLAESVPGCTTYQSAIADAIADACYTWDAAEPAEPADTALDAD